MKNYLIAFFILLSGQLAHAQISQQDASLMTWIHNYITQEIPGEGSGGYVNPSSLDLQRFKSIFSLLLDEEFAKVNDSLATYFPSYELIALTDTTFIQSLYYIIRESEVEKGWGTYVYNPNYQRDILIAVPHPIFDSNTPYEGVDMFQYLGSRFYAMAGTHRCAAAAYSPCSGTTSACGSSEKFRTSDMAHNNSTVFQIAHEAMHEIANEAWFLNLHGHADSNCEDVFLSNGRVDDPKPSLNQLKSALNARGVITARAGDGSPCTLTGTTNTQGRLVNGSDEPCLVSNTSNSGRFFHIEQFTSIRESQEKYRILIEEIGNLIPRVANTVEFPRFRSMTINEIHFFPIAPGGDTNGNGTVQTISDEFVELVNSDTETFDLSGWKLADAVEDRHVFPAGTTLVRGQALVVFGGTFTGNFEGALVQSATTGTLNLNNNRETVILRAPTGAPIYSYRYDTTSTQFSGGSLVRNPDITGNFEYHKTVEEASGSWFSPGKTITGNPFVPHAQITNVAGWRMLASPTDGFLLNDLSVFTAIQGITNSGMANLYTSYDGSEWVKPGALSTTIDAGTGFIIYFFNNNEYGSTELPVTLRASGTVKTTDVTIDLHSNGNKFNLIGNPFNQTIDYSQIEVNNGSLQSSVGHIWDPHTNSYTTTTALNDKVAAWQGFMIENNTAESITFPYASITTGGNLANGNAISKEAPTHDREIYRLSFELKEGNATTIYDQLLVVFDTDAEIGLDRLDAVKMVPLKPIDKLFAWKSDQQLQVQVSLPKAKSNPFLIDIEEFGAEQGALSIKWNHLFGPMNHRSIELYDYVQKKTSMLHHGDSLITIASQKPAQLNKGGMDQVILQSNAQGARFTATFFADNTSNPIPHTFELAQNFPNPFNPSTTIRYSIPARGDVTIEVFNILGERVSYAKLNDRAPGQHDFIWEAKGLSSGVYLYRITTASGVRSKKMMLLK